MKKNTLMSSLTTGLIVIFLFSFTNINGQALFNQIDVQQGGMSSFGNYDGIYNNSGTPSYPDYECNCWTREDQAYSIGKMGGSWYVFEHSECPKLVANMPYKYGLIARNNDCDPTSMKNIFLVNKWISTTL